MYEVDEAGFLTTSDLLEVMTKHNRRVQSLDHDVNLQIRYSDFYECLFLDKSLPNEQKILVHSPKDHADLKGQGLDQQHPNSNGESNHLKADFNITRETKSPKSPLAKTPKHSGRRTPESPVPARPQNNSGVHD
mmetsp:Transcript_6708/g.10456  ORF Transcript_6708/g.10456 Transcript_6708/m.10456 type:complete len:134 (-) Transcript_6708:327-728(-)